MRLPVGFEVRLREDVRCVGERLLVGGSPLRIVRLTPTALRMVQDGRIRVTGPRSAALAARLVDGNLADPVLTGTGVDPADLTVVVPVRDRPEQLTRALSHLTPLTCLVVDDGSIEPEAVAAVAERHGADLLVLPVNLGPAAARNAGLGKIRTPFVAFVDSDVAAPASALLQLTRHFVDERVALVGPLVRSRSRASSPRWFERFDEQDSSLTLGTRGCVVRPGAAVGWLPSACLVGRVDRLGTGFSAEMRVAEDVDLVWRLVDGGAVVRYDPSVKVDHDTRTSVVAWLGRKFVYGTGGADLALRHGRTGAPAVLSPTMALAAAALLIRTPWSVPIVVSCMGHGFRSLRRRLPPSEGRDWLAMRLVAQGVGWAVRQEAALVLRHWWPLTVLGATRSRTVRRAVVTSMLVDVLAARCDEPGASYSPVGRRLDDLAYGAGLWAGALRQRSIACLMPRRP